jgi:hypothetical protein
MQAITRSSYPDLIQTSRPQAGRLRLRLRRSTAVGRKKTDQTNSADAIAAIDATGSGKGVYIKSYGLKKSGRRLPIRDHMYSTATLETCRPPICRPRCSPCRQQFDLFCKLAVHVASCTKWWPPLPFTWCATSWPTERGAGEQKKPPSSEFFYGNIWPFTQR